MSATDYFDRDIDVGDVIWNAAPVTNISDGVITMVFTNVDGSQSTVTANSGTAGQTTNPAEGDRPPR